MSYYRAFVRSILLLVLTFISGCGGLSPHNTLHIDFMYPVDDPQFARTMGHLFGPPLQPGNSIQTLNNGDQIFPAMLDAIRGAQHTITFETFIYWKGDIGNQFTDALCERAKAGVKVHVLIDAVGSAQIDKGYLRRLNDAGAETNLYHALEWFDVLSLAKLYNRSHRKLLVVDGQIGFTGGVGIADEWAGNAQDPKHYRDMHYRLTGPAVSRLQAAFAYIWVETTGRIIAGDDYFPAIKSDGDDFAQVFPSSPRGGGSESMQLMYLMSFAAARHHIRLGTAYFVPDETTIRALVDARQCGAQVQVLIPGKYTDVPVTRRASRALWGKLLQAGVEIFEYEPTMYHTKLMIIDDRWTSIGSTNLDNRSFRLNAEANLNVLSQSFAQEQSKFFDEDLKHARRITYEEWQDRPLLEKLNEATAALLKWEL
jgi:cardiolipin synthase